MVVLGAVVAPATFEALPAREPETGRALAGAVFGASLLRFHWVSYACGIVTVLALGAMAALGPRPKAFAIRLAIATAMLGVAVYSGVVVLGGIDRVQREIGRGVAVSSLPATDERRVRFDRLHELSTSLMLVNIGAALVLLVWHARE